MKPNYIGVPFKADSYDGLSESNGIAKFSQAGIVIEYESKFLGMIGSDVKEVRIGLDEILDIKFKKGIYKFFSRIQIRLKNIEKLSKLPNTSGKVKLKIKREDFELAQKAVADTIQFMTGVAPKELEQEQKTNEELPPPQTSVNELFDTKKLESNETSKETNKLNK